MPTPPRLHSATLRRGSAGVALGLALTASVTGMSAAEAAGSTTHHNPHGSFSVKLHGRHAHFWGAALDPDTTRQLKIVVYIRGHKPVVTKTVKGEHGYSAWAWLPYGAHRVVAKAVNAGPGKSVYLGAKVLKVRNLARYNPVATSRAAHSKTAVRIIGRVLDRSKPHNAVALKLYRNGKWVRTVHSNPRTKHYMVRAALHNGANNFRLVAFNQGSGTRHVVTVKRVSIYRGAAWIARYHGNQHIAATLLPHYGWGESQMRALVQMWNRESGWNSRAANPSGAYGIPQSLPGSKMASMGSDWRTNPKTQIRWGLSYIKSRYGSPSNAWSIWQSQGSY